MKFLNLVNLSLIIICFTGFLSLYADPISSWESREFSADRVIEYIDKVLSEEGNKCQYTYYYTSSDIPNKDAKLLNVSCTIKNNGDSIYKVKFPRKNIIWTIIESNGSLICIHPGGMKQIFKPCVSEMEGGDDTMRKRHKQKPKPDWY